ncbi:S41 family peptidase [Streptomyces sp. NPDC046203]|uniref:S41 family peptidase n=1 Tax=Streptomyces sp. NPDC046203 TaxID=3154602 RepID=UPI003403EB3A
MRAGAGPEFCRRPRGVLRGAVLTLVFTGVIGTAAATGALPRRPAAPEPPAAAGSPDLSPPSGTALSAALGPGGPGGYGGSAVVPVDRDALARAAADAVADGKSGKQAAEEFVSRSGDRWGAVYDAREYAEFEQSLDGSYTGVGLSARRAGAGRVEISRVLPGGPAARAGLRAGDRITAVDGSPVGDRSVSEVVALLRGDEVPGSVAPSSVAPGSPAAGSAASGSPAADSPAAHSTAPGTTVTLGVERGRAAWSQPLRRARLVTDPVTVRRLDDGAVLVRVTAFTKGTGERIRTAVRTAPAGTGILLDLRGNSGGLLAEARTAASAFLDGGLIATYDMDGSQHAVYAEGGGDTARPLVALVDGGTMSAAELLTGALKDRGRAVTVGSRTFGKGSVQMPEALPGGSVAELTVGHYRTPAGNAVDGHGITPDVLVRQAPGARAEQRAEERARTVLSGLGGGS